jgi:transposase-like protein
MASDSMALLEQLSKAADDGDIDFLRQGVKALAQVLMEAEVSSLIGAEHGERAPERRLTQRNGYRERRWDTRVGTISLPIPRLREGSYFPALLEPRRRAERALLAVVQEAYVGGVSTRRVEELVAALGVSGISRSEVSRICAALDTEVDAFRSRPLDPAGYPYLWLDALYHKVREGGRVVSMATLIAVGVSAAGVRSVLGVEVAAAGGDEGAHWLGFLRSLSARGLAGVRLVISDAHPGLTAAIEATLLGAAWQRCRVHFTRNALALVSKAAQGLVASAVRSIFEQPDEESARAQLRRVADGLRPRFPKVAALLESAEADLLAHFTFPAAHRRQIRSANPQERLNKEIRRRTDVVGIFPTRTSLVRLVGMLLAEQDDEWAVGRAYFSAESMAQIDNPRPSPESLPELLMAS